MNLTQLIGTPFDELDCFALVRKCYEMRKNIIIAPISVPPTQSAKVFSEFMAQISKNWHKTQRQSDVCVALKYDKAHPKIVTHFGYMVDFFHILHTTQNTGAIIERFENLHRLIEGYYDYK